MGEAVLIGDKPGDGMVLSEYEHSAVRNLIRLSRMEESKEAEAIVNAIEACKEKLVTAFPRESLLNCFFKSLLGKLGEHTEEINAVFTNAWDEPVFLRDDESELRTKCVFALLKILESRSWLREFLLYSLPAFQREPYTPLEIMWRLSEEATNFNSDIEDAKRMLKAWPELVQPEAAADRRAEA